MERSLAYRLMLKELNLGWPLHTGSGWPAAAGGMLPRCSRPKTAPEYRVAQALSPTAHRPQTPPFVGWELQGVQYHGRYRSLAVLRVGPRFRLTKSLDGLVPGGPPSQAKLRLCIGKDKVSLIHSFHPLTLASGLNYLLLPSPPRQLTITHTTARDSLSLCPPTSLAARVQSSLTHSRTDQLPSLINCIFLFFASSIAARTGSCLWSTRHPAFLCLELLSRLLRHLLLWFVTRPRPSVAPAGLPRGTNLHPLLRARKERN